MAPWSAGPKADGPAPVPDHRSSRIGRYSAAVSGETPTRYVFVVTALASGGTLSVMREFWRRLERHGRIEVISHGPDSVTIDHPVTVTRGRFGGPMRFPAIWVYAVRTFVATLRVARAPGRAVLLPQDSLATGAASGLAGRLTGTPVVTMEHGTAVAIASDYFWLERLRTPRVRDRVTKPLLRGSVWILHRLALHLTDRFLTAGADVEAQLARHGVDASRMTRYHFPVDLELFAPAPAERRAATRARLGLDRDALVLASISRLTPEKGVDLVVAALAEIAEPLRPILVVAGDGPERGALEHAAGAAALDARFVGQLAQAEVAELLAASDLFVYAGRQGTNTPYAVLEAMASGLGVVATTEPAVHAEMLSDGRGVAVPPDDRPALAAAIRSLGEDPERRAEAARRARAYVEHNHAPEVLDRELAAALELGP